MSTWYRYGPWIAGSIVCFLALVGLMGVEGDDPISAGLLMLGRWGAGIIGILSLAGLIAEYVLFRRTNSHGSGGHNG